MLLVILATTVAVATAQNNSLATPDLSNRQLEVFRNSTPVPEVLTTSSGCPVQFRDTQYMLDPDFLSNDHVIETLTQIMNERTPLRNLHAKGDGAFGTFTVTQDVTDLTKAAFLSSVGKETRVAVRFSPTSNLKGVSDLANSGRGFAVKHYTEEGNFDVVGLSTPIFLTRDPLRGLNIGHINQNQVTDFQDSSALWDFATQTPEALFVLFYTFSPRGVPASYRTMPGYSVHTFQLANSANETYFSRIYYKPDLGIQNFTAGSSTDSNYLGRDLYNSISNGQYPSWTAYLQPFTETQVANLSSQGIDIFDITRVLPEEDYPLREFGKLVLNETPKNYFTDVEQLALNPGNLVPGIVGAPDQLFRIRKLAYKTTQIHRLGNNVYRIPVNKPLKAATYGRNGAEPNLDNGGGGPSYYPNTFNGPQPVPTNQPKLVSIVERVTSNFDQLSAYYESLSEAEKVSTTTIAAGALSTVELAIQNRALSFFTEANADLGSRISTVLQRLRG